jgi:hypothetical protein
VEEANLIWVTNDISGYLSQDDVRAFVAIQFAAFDSEGIGKRCGLPYSTVKIMS